MEIIDCVMIFLSVVAGLGYGIGYGIGYGEKKEKEKARKIVIDLMLTYTKKRDGGRMSHENVDVLLRAIDYTDFSIGAY